MYSNKRPIFLKLIIITAFIQALVLLAFAMTLYDYLGKDSWYRPFVMFGIVAAAIGTMFALLFYAKHFVLEVDGNGMKLIYN